MSLDSIRRGLEALLLQQRHSGEFPTFTAPTDDLQDCVPLARCSYTTTFVIHTLELFPGLRSVRRACRMAAAYLLSQREDDGSWHYLGRGASLYPCDVDDTSCALASLFRLGYPPEASSLRLLRRNLAGPGGPHYTWIEGPRGLNPPLRGEVDSLVNANVLFCAGILGARLPCTAQYLAELIRREDYKTGNRYTLEPHFLIYALARAYEAGGAPELGPVLGRLVAYVLDKLPPPAEEPVALRVAFLAAALLAVDARRELVRPYIERLLQLQCPEGGWPAWAVNWGILANRDGSPAMTTAIALQALARWRPDLALTVQPTRAARAEFPGRPA